MSILDDNGATPDVHMHGYAWFGFKLGTIGDKAAKAVQGFWNCLCSAMRER
jgi:hypothetical protein